MYEYHQQFFVRTGYSKGDAEVIREIDTLVIDDQYVFDARKLGSLEWELYSTVGKIVAHHSFIGEKAYDALNDYKLDLVGKIIEQNEKSKELK